MERGLKGMIKRVSMWRLKDPSEAEHMKGALLSMQGNVPSLCAIEVGVNTSTHHSALDVVFIGSFEDASALAEFDKDRFHKSVGRLVGALKEERVVVEYEV